MTNSTNISAQRPGDRLTDMVSRTLDCELQLIVEAVAMVASGTAPRVIVANLRFADQLQPRAEALAKRAGLRAVPIWTRDETHRSSTIGSSDD